MSRQRETMGISEKDVAEFAIDATTKGIGKAVISRIVAYARGPDMRLREMEEIEARSWRAHRDQEVQRRLNLLEEQAKDQAAFRAKAEAMARDRQFAKMHRNLEFEAIRETLSERRRMLAIAAGGLSDPSMGIGEKARIERALRELDPPDIRLLRNPPKYFVNDETALSFLALVKTGCLMDDQGQDPTDENYLGQEYEISPLGEMVLYVLEEYEPKIYVDEWGWDRQNEKQD